VTVKELIEALQKLPPESEVYYTDRFDAEADPKPRDDGDGRVSL
jgi:hypothetical protein